MNRNFIVSSFSNVMHAGSMKLLAICVCIVHILLIWYCIWTTVPRYCTMLHATNYAINVKNVRLPRLSLHSHVPQDKHLDPVRVRGWERSLIRCYLHLWNVVKSKSTDNLRYEGGAQCYKRGAPAILRIVQVDFWLMQEEKKDLWASEFWQAHSCDLEYHRKPSNHPICHNSTNSIRLVHLVLGS